MKAEFQRVGSCMLHQQMLSLQDKENNISTVMKTGEKIKPSEPVKVINVTVINVIKLI